jgi:hypothetical protein
VLRKVHTPKADHAVTSVCFRSKRDCGLRWAGGLPPDEVDFRDEAKARALRRGSPSWAADASLEVAMSLEMLNTLGTLTTVAIVAATAIAALVQLRHLRAGNQINAMLSIGENFANPGYRDAVYLVNRKLAGALEDPVFREYCAALSRGQQPPEVDGEYVDLRRAANLIGNTYEELGILVKNGIVDRSLFLDRYYGVIIGSWNRLSKFNAFCRAAERTSAGWENFEYLTVLSEDWKRLHPTTYPKGVRRLDQLNPWPVPEPAAS